MPSYNKKLNHAVLDGIVRDNGGNYYGFNMRFQTPELAQHYKDMIMWILKSDKLKVEYKIAYYDRKEV